MSRKILYFRQRCLSIPRRSLALHTSNLVEWAVLKLSKSTKRLIFYGENYACPPQVYGGVQRIRTMKIAQKPSELAKSFELDALMGEKFLA